MSYLAMIILIISDREIINKTQFIYVICNVGYLCMCNILIYISHMYNVPGWFCFN